MPEYKVYTTIPRNFDPEVIGVTLVSIVESCEGYVSHSVPLNEKNTIINMETSQPLDYKYLIDQLNDNFRAMGEQTSVVQRVVRKDL